MIIIACLNLCASNLIFAYAVIRTFNVVVTLVLAISWQFGHIMYIVLLYWPAILVQENISSKRA